MFALKSAVLVTHKFTAAVKCAAKLKIAASRDNLRESTLLSRLTTSVLSFPLVQQGTRFITSPRCAQLDQSIDLSKVTNKAENSIYTGSHLHVYSGKIFAGNLFSVCAGHASVRGQLAIAKLSVAGSNTRRSRHCMRQTTPCARSNTLSKVGVSSSKLLGEVRVKCIYSDLRFYQP